MKTNFQDPGSTEILSPNISGLQEAVGKIEDILNLQTTAETDVALTEVYISASDRYRIYQAAVGKRNWLLSPAPVIKKNGGTIVTGFTIDYAGGAIVLGTNAIVTDVFTASFTRTNSTPAIPAVNTKIADAGSIITATDVEAALQEVVTNQNTHLNDYVRQPGSGVTTGSANTYALTLTPALTAYTAFVGVTVQINAANTGASTINVNGLGAKSIRDSKGVALTAGKLVLNGVYTLRYDGTNFILQGEGGDIAKLTNLIKNGSFENIGWMDGTNASYSTVQKKFGATSRALTGVGAETTSTSNEKITTFANDKYYLSCWGYPTVAGASVQLYARIAEPSVTGILSNINAWNFFSGIVTFTTTLTDFYRVDNNTAGSIIYFDGLMMFNLTDAFGAGKEPSVAEMDAMVNAFGGWWDSPLQLLTADATAVAGDILAGDTAYANGVLVTGTMPSKGVATITPSTVDQTIAAGQYLSGIQTIASLGGSATAAQVLAGVPFSSNVAGRSATGTMPNRAGGYHNAIAANEDAGWLLIRPPAGYYDGATNTFVYAADPNFTAPNIKSGVNIFGVTGTAGNIKSIQRGSYALSSTSGTVSITAVNLSQAIVKISYYPGAGQTGNANAANITATLTSTTQVTFNKVVGTGSVEIDWEVIEFDNVKSLQTGSVDLNSVASVNVSITSVNTSKSILFFSFTNNMNTAVASYWFLKGKIASATQLTFAMTAANSPSIVASWQVIEFN